MLETMQKLALCYLWKQLEGNREPPVDLQNWFLREKENNPVKFFSYLVEPAGRVEKYYTLSLDSENDDTAILESADISNLGESIALKLPYFDTPPKGTKYPVLKRTLDKNKLPTPKRSVITKSLKVYEKFKEDYPESASFFNEVLNIFRLRKVKWEGEVFQCENTAFELATNLIKDTKTVFLTIKDSNGCLPGERNDYCQFFAKILADQKYGLDKAPAQLGKCNLCNADSVKCYSAGLSNAGVDIFNIGRIGAFPGILEENAYLSYSICENCADLLYIFKFHVLPSYLSYVAGEEALFLPELYLSPKSLNKFLGNFKNYSERIKTCPKGAIIQEKKRLGKILSNERAICTIDIIWSKESFLGQKLKDVSGNIIDVLPSRLRDIFDLNNDFESMHRPLFPKYRVDKFEFDLNLSFIKELLHRPGGRKAKGINSSRKLTELKRLLVEAIYKNKLIPEKRFWEEVMVTAKWYYLDSLHKDKIHMDYLYEGYSEKGKKISVWMSFAGWIRHLAMTLEYFKFIGVIEKMESKRNYSPQMEELKKYFADDSGINSDEKAFAFILGILYGRVMQIQGAKGVNVSSNSLTWLKRLTLSGKDLPGLYVKVREKLLAYDAENIENVRKIIKEIGTLGNSLGSDISLGQTECCYFLLLGQSLSIELFPSNKKNSLDNK